MGLLRRAAASNGRCAGAADKGFVRHLGARRYADFGRLCVARVRDHLPVAHGQYAVGIGADVGLVGDDDDGDALLAIEPRQRFHDFVRVAGVEVAGRFVGEQQAGRVDQGARDRHALLLAARELAGRIAFAVAQAQQLERRARPLDARAGAGWPGGRVEQRQRHVLERAGAGQKIEALEHEAQAFAAQPRAFGLAQAGDVGALKIITPAARPVETPEHRHERRLARSGRAHDGDEFAGVDREAHVLQRMHVDVADMVCPLDVLEPDDRFRHGQCIGRWPRYYGRRGAAGLLLLVRCSAMMTWSSAFSSPLTISV